MKPTEIIRFQRLLALLALGICDALQNEAMSIDEAENLLFSPHSIRRCEEIGASGKLIAILDQGTELDAIKRLLPSEQGTEALIKMREEARSLLRAMESSDPELEKWIDQIALYDKD